MNFTARAFCATIFENEMDRMMDLHPGQGRIPEWVRYGIGQLEVAPTTMRRHWQCYFELTTPKTLRQMKTIFGEGHYEKRHGTRDQAKAYCQKEESRVTPVKNFEFGNWEAGGQGTRTELKEIGELVLAGASAHDCLVHDPATFMKFHGGICKAVGLRAQASAPKWRQVAVDIFWGETGTGKTRRAVEENPNHYILRYAEGATWFDGYDRNSTLILDEFNGQLKWEMLLQILDGYQMQLWIKGGSTWAYWDHVVITSNLCPARWYLEKFRSGALQPASWGAFLRRITRCLHFPAIGEEPVDYMIPDPLDPNLP